MSRLVSYDSKQATTGKFALSRLYNTIFIHQILQAHFMSGLANYNLNHEIIRKFILG